MQSAALKLEVHEARLQLHDQGLVARAMAAGAKAKHEPVERYQPAQAQAIGAAFLKNAHDEPAARKIASAVTAFLANPGSLSLDIKSKPPLRFSDLPLLQEPALLLRRLMVSATTGPR